MAQSLSYLWVDALSQHWSMASVTLPRMTAAQAASVVGICQTLLPQAVLVALTDEVVVDILVDSKGLRSDAVVGRKFI